MSLGNRLFSIEVESMRLRYRVCGDKPTSAPYLSGDGFRSLCHHHFEGEGRSTFDPSLVRKGDRIFCESWHLEEFLRGPGPDIACPFSVVSHNGDLNVDADVLALMPSMLRQLFAQNLAVHDCRAVAIPIGLENKRLHCNGITGDFDMLRARPRQKAPRILSAFSVGTNPAVRAHAAEQLSSCRLSDTVARMNSRAYRIHAAGYMFIASPPGNGLDCHRTWEAMYTRSVPIVMRSPAMEAFEKLGMPLKIVDSYREVAAWSEADAVAIYGKLEPQFDCTSLWFDYWKDIILGNHGAS
jgi:hypothetical protein